MAVYWSSLLVCADVRLSMLLQLQLVRDIHGIWMRVCGNDIFWMDLVWAMPGCVCWLFGFLFVIVGRHGSKFPESYSFSTSNQEECLA